MASKFACQSGCARRLWKSLHLWLGAKWAWQPEESWDWKVKISSIISTPVFIPSTLFDALVEWNHLAYMRFQQICFLLCNSWIHKHTGLYTWRLLPIYCCTFLFLFSNDHKIYPKKYAHVLAFVVLWCSLVLSSWISLYQTFQHYFMATE